MADYYGNNDWRDYLAHYGVKGMKWRKHKYKDKLGDVYDYASGKVKNFVDYKITGKGYLRDAKKNRLKASKYSNYSYGSAQAARGRMLNGLANKQIEKYNSISRRNSKIPGVKYKPADSINTGAVGRRAVGGRWNTYDNLLGNSKGPKRVVEDKLYKNRGNSKTLSKVSKVVSSFKKQKTKKHGRVTVNRNGKLRRLHNGIG